MDIFGKLKILSYLFSFYAVDRLESLVEFSGLLKPIDILKTLIKQLQRTMINLRQFGRHSKLINNIHLNEVDNLINNLLKCLALKSFML